MKVYDLTPWNRMLQPFLLQAARTGIKVRNALNPKHLKHGEDLESILKHLEVNTLRNNLKDEGSTIVDRAFN